MAHALPEHAADEADAGIPGAVRSAAVARDYDARVKDRGLRFDAANAGATFVTDRETHSTWNAYGLAVKGPLKGTQLKPLILIREFWFAWSQFRPGTRLFSTSTVQTARLD